MKQRSKQTIILIEGCIIQTNTDEVKIDLRMVYKEKMSVKQLQTTLLMRHVF